MLTEGDAFDVVAPEISLAMAHLLPQQEEEENEDSWTMATPSTTPRSWVSEEEKVGGGDVEGAPNNWDGGSNPVAMTSNLTRMEWLRTSHAETQSYIEEEMERLDATSAEQAHWLPAIAMAIQMKHQWRKT